MATKVKQIKQLSPETPEVVYPTPPFRIDPNTFTKTVNTVIYAPWQGFANYSVATIEIKDGEIVSVSYSGHVNSEEALIRLDKANKSMMNQMRVNYPPGYNNA